MIEYSDTEISVLRARVAEALTEADRLLSQLSDDGSVIGDAVERIHEGVAQSDEAAVIRLDTKALADRAEVAQAPDITIADAVDTLGLQAAERGLWIGVALAYRVLAGVPATGITNGAR